MTGAISSAGAIRLVVFDLDGTLIDSRRDLADATNELIAGLGGSPLPEEAVGNMVGEGARVLVARALAAAHLDPATPGALDRFLELYGGCLLRHTRPYPGVPEVLRALSTQLPLAVLTNKPAQATDRILGGLALRPFFSEVVGGDGPLGRKPDPQGFLTLIARAGTTPSSTLLVGDSVIDLQTARNARARVCIARYGFGYRQQDMELGPDEHCIDAPGEVTRVCNSSRR